MLTLTENGTEIIVAAISATAAIVVGLVGVIAVQLKVHRDNRSDHADTARKVDQLVEGQYQIAADVRDVKEDVRVLKATDRQIERRLDDHISGAVAGD
jgi:uncharacterized protein YlxW (UPF0749 family)